MIITTTGITTTNPNDDNARHIYVRLSSTQQEVKALYLNPLNLNRSEQRPNIKIGTEVLLLFDEGTNVFTCIGSLQQGNDNLSEKKQYLIENKDEVGIKTDLFKSNIKKLVIKNDTAELVSTLIEWLDALIVEKHIGNLGALTALSPDSIAQYMAIKAKIESFQE